jgi:hypothetical protein
MKKCVFKFSYSNNIKTSENLFHSFHFFEANEKLLQIDHSQKGELLIFQELIFDILLKSYIFPRSFGTNLDLITNNLLFSANFVWFNHLRI